MPFHFWSTTAATSGEYSAKAETSLQSAKMKTMIRKFGMGMVIVMLMMKPLMMITRMRIRRTIIMIEQPVEEEVQVGSVCPPAGGGPVQGVHQAGVGQELQQLHLPLLGDTLQLPGEGQSLGSVEEGVAPPGNTNWLRYLL